MVMNSEEMAENLDKSHAYIPGITPGENTSKYIKNSISKLTVVGSLFLVILAMLFFEFIRDNSSTPLNFNTLFRVE